MTTFASPSEVKEFGVCRVGVPTAGDEVETIFPEEYSNCMPTAEVGVTDVTGRAEGDILILTGVVWVSDVAVDLVESEGGVCGEVAGVSTPRAVVKVCCSVATASVTIAEALFTSPATAGGGTKVGTATWMVEPLAKVIVSKFPSGPVSPFMTFPLSLGFVATTRP